MLEKVLVVDDEPGVVQLCCRILAQRGYKVQGLSRGQEAIAYLESEPIDLLVVDIKMPDVDGLTVLRRGRELYPDLAAIIITGFATLSSAVSALHAGVHRFVLKPFGVDEFVQAVQETLEQWHQDQERRRLRAQLPILEIAQALLAEGDLKLLACQLLKPVARELAAEQAALLLSDNETDDLCLVSAIGPLADAAEVRIPVGSAFLEQMRQAAAPFVLEPQEWLAQFLPAALTAGPVTVVCVPLRTVKRLVGVLCLSRLKSRPPFTSGDLGLLTIIGGQVATVVENARLYEVVARGKREWETTFDAIADGISIHDADFRLLRANRSLADMVGRPLPELLGRRCYELIHGTAKPPSFCPAIPALSTKQAQTVECELPLLRGFFQCTAYPLGLGAGATERFVHVVRDITAQKRAEAQTRAQRDLGVALAGAAGIAPTARLCLEAAIRATGMDSGGIYLVDETGALELIVHQGLSADFAAHTGHLASDSPNARLVAAGRPLYMSYAALDVPCDEIRAREGLRSLAVIPISHEGRVIACLNVASHTLDAVPEFGRATLETIAHLVGSAIARAQSEEALRRRNEELTALNAIAAIIGQPLDLDRILGAALDKVLELTALEGGCIHLRDERTGLWRPAVCRNVPAALVEALGHTLWDEGLTGTVVQPGPPHPAAERTAADAGPQEALPAAVVPLRAQDRELGVLTLFGQSERGLEPHYRPLLTAIGHQLGVAVENAQLLQQTAEVEALRQLDRLRAELTANVSHELRTPLGLIQVMSTTLLRQDMTLDEATRREFLTDIVDECKRLEKILDNLLDLSRLEDGRLHVERRVTDLGRLLQETTTEMARQAPRHRLLFQTPDEPLRANVDPERIGQVLRNLVSNAIKYSPDGGTVTLRGRPVPGGVLLQVADEGPGIPPEYQERVFERFFRVPNEVTAQERGAGLGLAVCKGIVEAHGGRIWVESTPGQGSTFSLILPA